jgi:photosystem II stability/assembly factor-like uncharacterized protein
MKKILLIIVFISSILQLNLYSQWGWFQVTSGTSNTINDIQFYGHMGFAVGNNGLILKSTDDGSSWVQQPSGTTANLMSIDFQSYTSWIGCIAGTGGTILRSTSTSGPWMPATSGITNDLNFVMIGFDTNLVMAAGNNGKIIYSMNQGLNWINFPTPTSVNLYGIAQGNNGFIAIGQTGTILTTMGLGYNWVLRNSGTTNDLNSITAYTSYSDNYIAAGNNGTLLKTTNAGLNWIPVTSGTIQNLTEIGEIELNYYQPPVNVCYLYASGENGTVLMSHDSGTSWQNPYTPVQAALNSINFSSINTGFASGVNGTIIKIQSNHYYIDNEILNANQISTPYYNDGINNFDRPSNSAGFEWPKGSGKHARFGSGLWVGALVNNEIRVATLQYNENEYYPGYTNSSGIPEGRNDSNYRIYKLTYGQNNIDRQRWPNSALGNSNQGAPVYFDSISNSWRALDFGSQTLFLSYTDAYPESHLNYWGGMTNPLKSDVKQLTFALDVQGTMANVIITQYTIINHSNNIWNDAYFTIWTDDDIGNQSDDKAGCDSVLQLGFSYNGNSSDPIYGSTPPAVGYLLLKGASYYTGNNNDTIRFCRNKNTTYITKYRDRGMSVFNYSANGDAEYPDPTTPEETYNLMKGLRVDGSPIISPFGYTTKLMYSGDPVGGNGWNQLYPADVRFQVTTGPVNMNPGDTQTIVCAQIIGAGSNNRYSINVIRQYAAQVKQYYQSCYTSIPIGIKEDITEIPGKYLLFQNYPNPFNPATKIKFDLPKSNLTLSEAKGLWVRLIIYDILGREVTTLVNEQLKPGTYEVEWDGTKYSSGVYYYTLTAGTFSETKKMVLIK